MIEMNPYYAHDSQVGAVFDVATWSPRKALTMVIVGVIASVLFGAATLYAYDPWWATSLAVKKADAPELLRQANDDLVKTQKKHPWAARGGMAFLAFMTFVCVTGSVSAAFDFASGEFYFRAGPGGMSLCVPAGASWKRFGMHPGALNIDIPWSEIREWKVVQKKELGSLSANAGNLEADIKIYLRNGSKHVISLDIFREPARIIYNRINDATEMTAAQLEPGTARLDEEALVEAGYGE